jgi:nucleoside-diphosphate-sugar epimerase
MGQFYGTDSFSRQIVGMARRGLVALLGDADSYQSSIWIDDAAEAVVAALQPTVPAGIYDIVDDEPMPRREVIVAMANAVGRRGLRRLPVLLVKLATGVAADNLSLDLRVSNRRFKQASGWAPRVPSEREGWQLAVADTLPATSRPEYANPRGSHG